MPTQLDSFGFQDLRTYIKDNWPYIAVFDSGGNEVLRWDVASHTSAQYSSGPSGNPLQAELTITGQDILDAGGSLPVTITESESYKVDSGGTRTSHDTFNGIDVEVQGDEAVVIHNFRLPP